MRKLFIFFRNSLPFVLILLQTNAKSQSNDYNDFSTESLKSNRQYSWNFNPIDYDPSILNACILDIINLARMQYNVADALTNSEILEEAAKIQSAFMAKKEERTQNNVVKKLQTPEFR